MDSACGAYYAVIPATIRYDPDLAANAKLLYGELTSLCNKTGYCWATNQYFAELYGLSERTVSRLIVQLEGKGYIRCEMAPTDKGSERRIYAGVFVVQGDGGVDKNVHTPPDKNVEGGVDKNVYQNNKNINNKQDNTPYSPPGGDGPGGGAEPVDKPNPQTRRTRGKKSEPDYWPKSFGIMWDAYPRKDNRKKAIDAWDKLRPDLELCRVMYDALKRQCRDPQWAEEGGKYIPMFSTWLNQRRWENQGVDLSLIQSARLRGSGGWAPDPEVTR